MKKLFLATLLCGVSVLATAQPITMSYSRQAVINNGINNYLDLVQCQEITEDKIMLLSRINMQNQICMYESYAKLTKKFMTEPPEQYISPKSIVITLNQKEITEKEKEYLENTSNQCQSLALKMRKNIKDMYSVDNLVCK